MKNITNTYIQEVINSYISGDNESIRPFSSPLINESTNNIIDSTELYKDENGDIYYPIYTKNIDDVIEGNYIFDTEISDYKLLLTKEDFNKQLIDYTNYTLSINDIEDFTKEEQEVIKEVEEYINNK